MYSSLDETIHFNWDKKQQELFFCQKTDVSPFKELKITKLHLVMLQGE